MTKIVFNFKCIYMYACIACFFFFFKRLIIYIFIIKVLFNFKYIHVFAWSYMLVTILEDSISNLSKSLKFYYHQLIKI